MMAPRGPIFDADVLAETARVHEDAGFDRVLIGYFTNAPDGFLVAAHVAASTERLGLLLAHRPGFVAPTLAARKLATLDQLSKGRAAVHIISGGSDADQARDGDFADHGVRYRRSAEYVRVLRRTWTARQPFDHDGEFYRVDGAHSDITPWSGDEIPVYGGGGSDDAIDDAGARHRHVHAVGRAARRDRRVHGAGPRAAAGDNEIRLQRVDPADHRRDRGRRRGTKARGYLDTILAASTRPAPTSGPERRLAAPPRPRRTRRGVRPLPLDPARRRHRRPRQLDRARRHARDGRRGARRLRRRRRRRTLLIRGYEPLADAAAYGRELIPRVREIVRQRRTARLATATA